MSNTTKLAGAGQSIAGWSNGPNNITAIDNQVAVSDVGSAVCTLLAKNFGFTIPTGDILVGLKVEVLCGWQGDGGTNLIATSPVVLIPPGGE